MSLSRDKEGNMYWQGHEIIKLPRCLATYLLNKTCADCGQSTESAMLFEDIYVCLKCFKIRTGRKNG